MTNKKQTTFLGFSHITKSLPKIKKPSKTQMRVMQVAVTIQQEELGCIAYQHSALCQTCMPYRDPGIKVLEWEREQGAVSLLIQSGKVRSEGKWKVVGLPFGPKPRLILSFLNGEALRSGSRTIEVDDSLTAFVKRIGLHTHGRNIKTIKDQLTRLSAAEIRMAMQFKDQYKQAQGHIVSGFDLWFPKAENQRVLWPTTVTLSAEYFQSLVNHAVPLDERALGALAHSAMALDIYAWLAQRLHRVHNGEVAFIAWANLKSQFGPDYKRMCKFKEVFRTALKQVKAVYPGARFDLDGRGMDIYNSPPPVKKKLIQRP